MKVGILVRLGHHLNHKGKEIVRLHQRRLVAVLGDIDALNPRLMLEALRQEWQKAKKVVWISDLTFHGIFGGEYKLGNNVR